MLPSSKNTGLRRDKQCFFIKLFVCVCKIDRRNISVANKRKYTGVVFFVPVSMQIGGLLFIHLRNVLKTHLNNGIVSSRMRAIANMVLCR